MTRTDAPSETWAPIWGWSKYYEVSDRGRIRSKRTGKLIIQRANPSGYLKVDLVRSAEGHRHRVTRYVHRIVCRAFRGPPPFRGAECHHLDADNRNNEAWNLVWVSKQQNLAEQWTRRRPDPVPF